MNALKQVISTFSTEDQDDFINYLKRKNRRSDHKNIELFKLLSEQKWNSKQLFEELYEKDKKNAYHALRKRLYKSIINFVAQKNLDSESSVDMQSIKYILAARTFFQLQLPTVAHDLLKKAELLAIDEMNYPVLNEIYHTQIQYAYAIPDIDLDGLIKKFRKNQESLQNEENLNIAYAKIKMVLSKFNFNDEIVDFNKVINDILKEQSVNIDRSMILKSLYQLMALSSMKASIDKNYSNIESFLVSSYEKIKDHTSKDKHLYYHIEIVYLIANMLFRNKKFESSMQYLETMERLMSSSKNKYWKRFEPKLLLLRSLNLNYSNHPLEAIESLKSIKKAPQNDFETTLDIRLALTMFYFQQGRLKEAKSLFASLYHTDNYYIERAGKECVIKKNLMEILLHIEMNHLDLAESRIRSFKRSHTAYLKKIGEDRVISYLNLAEVYFKHPENVTTEKFHNKVEKSFDWEPLASEDIFVISFYAWLKSKMEARSIYETTLDLVERSKPVN